MECTRKLGGKCPYPGTLGIRNLAKLCLIFDVLESMTLRLDLIASEWGCHSTVYKEGIVPSLERDWANAGSILERLLACPATRITFSLS